MLFRSVSQSRYCGVGVSLLVGVCVGVSVLVGVMIGVSVLVGVIVSQQLIRIVVMPVHALPA